MNKLCTIFILSLIVFPFISATPQIVQRSIGVEIEDDLVKLKFQGEVIAIEKLNLSIDCGVNCTLQNYSIAFDKELNHLFVVDITGNDTDLGFLINEMRTFNQQCLHKISDLEKCMDTNRNLVSKLEDCEENVDYKSQYNACVLQRDSFQKDVDDLESNKLLYPLVAFVAGAGACFMYFKNKGVIPSQPVQDRVGSFSEKT